MPQPPEFRASAPPSVGSNVIYPQQQNNQFMADLGSAFNLVKGGMDMFKKDPNEARDENTIFMDFLKRRDAADSEAQKTDISKEALAYAKAKNNKEMEAVFTASDPKAAMSQSQRLRKQYTDETLAVAKDAYEGVASPNPAVSGQPLAAPGAQVPPATAQAISAPGGQQPPQSPIQQSQPPTGQSALSGKPGVPPPITSEVQGAPGNPPPQEPELVGTNQGMDPNQWGKQYHPLQLQVAVQAGIDPDQVKLSTPNPAAGKPGGYPYVDISNMAARPDLPFDAFFEPPPPGPEDQAIMQTYQATVPKAQHLVRSLASLRILGLGMQGTPVTAADALGGALAVDQAEMQIREMAVSAGVTNVKFGNVMSMAQILSASDPADLDLAKPEFSQLQADWDKMAPGEQKALMAAAKLYTDSGLQWKTARDLQDWHQKQALDAAVKNNIAAGELDVKAAKAKWDMNKDKTLLPLMVQEYHDKHTTAGATIAQKNTELGQKNREQDWKEAQDILARDERKMNRKIQLAGLASDMDPKAKAYFEMAQMYGAQITKRTQDITNNKANLIKTNAQLDTFKEGVYGDINKLPPDKKSEFENARDLAAQIQADITEAERLNKVDMAAQRDYLQKSSSIIETSGMESSRQQQVKDIMREETELDWAPPGLTVQQFVQGLAERGVDQVRGKQLWAKYQKQQGIR